MKKITGLNEEIKDLEGKQCGLTIRKALLQVVSMARVSGEDSIRLITIGQDLIKATKELDYLDESEVIFKKVVNDNGVGYPVFVLAVLHGCLNKAIAVSKDKEKK